MPELLVVVRSNFPTFHPHPLLRNGHAQSVASLFPRRVPQAFLDQSEARVFTVDPHTRVLGYCHWQADRRQAGTVVLLHGLIGSAESNYILSTGYKAWQAGFNVLRLNQRNCGETEHLTRTLYHSGLTDDLRAAATALAEEERLPRLYLGGFSMGGNIVLKLAGEWGPASPSWLAGVVAVSAPIDLPSASIRLDAGGVNGFYQRYLLNGIRRLLKRRDRLFPGTIDLNGLEDIRRFREYDERYTAPAFGFADADHYYREASALPWLPALSVPALAIHARDDSLIPFTPYESEAFRSAERVSLLAAERGGHTGFIAGTEGEDPDRRWAENRMVEFFSGLEREIV